MSIQAMGEKIKGFWDKEGRDILLIAIVVLTGVGGYCIGIYSKTTEPSASPILVKIEGSALTAGAPRVLGQSTSEGSLASSSGFVASRNGTKYYPLGCGSVSRINEENKVFFQSEEEAQNAGYTRTTSCK